MMAISDYAGRTVDLLAFQGVDGPSYIPLQQALTKPGQPGEVCTGLQKLAQRFLLELLTRQGTILYMPDRGCDFLTELDGNVRSVTDISGAFERALTDITTNLTSEETPDDPTDEQFSEAILNEVRIDEDRISLDITLVSEAGSNQRLILPMAIST
jgi:hypothetical protein